MKLWFLASEVSIKQIAYYGLLEICLNTCRRFAIVFLLSRNCNEFLLVVLKSQTIAHLKFGDSKSIFKVKSLNEETEETLKKPKKNQETGANPFTCYSLLQYYTIAAIVSVLEIF